MKLYIGIDVGGTHTDAVLYGQGQDAPILLSAKVKTRAQSKESVAACMGEALEALWRHMQDTLPHAVTLLPFIQRITLSTTLGLNALIQGNAAPVGLLYTAGPGMDAGRFLQNSCMGQYAFRVPGGLDHRGYEVSPLDLGDIAWQVKNWRKTGVKNFAVAGKFSVRNACHEQTIAKKLQTLGVKSCQITLSHSLTGQLNFVRRMAAAYINASIYEVQQSFLQAVRVAVQNFYEAVGGHASLMPPLYLLKADGGALSLDAALATPLFSVLSGPAASVMGGMALGEFSYQEGDGLLLDVGGTTTDMAVYAQGLPVVSAEGMPLTFGTETLLTPLRALATRSLRLGGDTPLYYAQEQNELLLGSEQGLVRQGEAMVFGGSIPTLVDALALLCTEKNLVQGMDIDAAQQGLEKLTNQRGQALHTLLSKLALRACNGIISDMHTLLQLLHGRPVYTLAQLLEDYAVQPKQICLVGGPAALLYAWLAPLVQQEFGAKLLVPKLGACANALGAALTLPTDHVQFLADTLEGQWHIPTLGLQGQLKPNFTLEKAIDMTLQALKDTVSEAEQDLQGRSAEVVEALSFATLDERGRGGKDIRVQCQWRPGLVLSAQELMR